MMVGEVKYCDELPIERGSDLWVFSHRFYLAFRCGLGACCATIRALFLTILAFLTGSKQNKFRAQKNTLGRSIFCNQLFQHILFQLS